MSMKKIREVSRNMSVEEIREDVERIKNKFPQLASSCDAIHFNNPDGAIHRDYEYLLKDVEDLEDTELQDFYTFKDCQDRLEALHSEVSNYWECNASDFGEALATDREVAEKEYKALEDAYKNLHDELYPIMKDSYKGYKDHCEFCRIPYNNYEEFEEANEEDLFASILGM